MNATPAIIDDNETDAEFEARRDAERLDAWHKLHKLGKYTEVLVDLTQDTLETDTPHFARYHGKAVVIDAILTGGKRRVRYCGNACQSGPAFDVQAHELSAF